MQFTEPAELEDLVGLLRSERMLEVATAELSQWAGGQQYRGAGAGMRNGAGNQRFNPKPSLFGADLTVARLFASSPPANTYTVEEDDFREEYDQKAHSKSRDSQSDRAGKENGNEEEKKEESSVPISFSLEQVVDQPQVRPGYLTSLIGTKNKGGENNNETATNVQNEGPKIELMLYLPDQTPLNIRVPVEATVLEAIRLLLEYDKIHHHPPKLFPDPEKYEFRIHEEDGLPDLDLPAMDGAMQVSNFFEGDKPEYCVCVKAGQQVNMSEESSELIEELQKDPSAKEEQTEREREQPKLTRTELAEKAFAEKRGTGIVLIKIYLPENGSYMTVSIYPGMKAVKLLSTIQAKQRLPLFTEEYQFILPDDEKERLGFHSEIVDMKINLYDSGIRNLELRRRKYADAPSVDNASNHNDDEFFRDRGNSAAIHHDEVTINKRPAMVRFDPDNFLFNDQTAALYEQWNVIKTNKWGKRQRRVFGIDYHKIYNKKQSKDVGKNMLADRQVKRAERLLSDVESFGITRDDPCCIQIVWREGSGNNNPTIPLKYEMENSEIAAYVIAKMRFLLAKQK